MSRRARRSRSSTASPRSPRINAHLRHKAANLRSVALDAAAPRKTHEVTLSRSTAARVGKGAPCYVIAEAGVNHNCDVQLGYKLVETAGASGADAIKFQSYTAGKIATRVAPRYWVEPPDPNGTQWDTFDKPRQALATATSRRCSGTRSTSG